MSTTALQHTQESAITMWSGEEILIIKQVIAPDLTDAELIFFAHACRRYGLDPLMNQIHAIKRNARERVQENGQWVERWAKRLTIQTSIHGLRLIARRTGNYAPGRRTEFAYDASGALASATAFVKVWEHDEWHEVAETAYWTEYAQTYEDRQTREQKPVALWASKPHVMLAKCSEALALRRAFPAETAGLYTDDEMAQADVAPVAPARSLPASTPPPPSAARSQPARATATPGSKGERPSGAAFDRFWRVAKEQNWSQSDVQKTTHDLFGKRVDQAAPAELAALEQLVRGEAEIQDGDNGPVIVAIHALPPATETTPAAETTDSAQEIWESIPNA